MKNILSLIWVLLALCVINCDFGSRGSSAKTNTNTGSNLSIKTCAELSDPATCLEKGASAEICAYNYSTGSCIKAPSKIAWPEQTISAGADYVCAVDSMGDIRCWFGDGLGGLARGGTSLESRYHQASGTYQTVSAVAHGHAYELLTATNDQGQIFSAGFDYQGSHKDLKAWTDFTKSSGMAFSGYNSEYRCSLTSSDGLINCKNNTSTAAMPKTTSRPRFISHSFSDFCIIDNDLAIHCYGDEPMSKGPFANAIPAGLFERVAIPVVYPGNPVACAIRWTDSKLSCWSQNASDVVNNMPANFEASHIAVSEEFAVAIGTDGKLRWWGNAAKTEAALIRDEIATFGQDPMAVVVAGEHFACALKKDGTPICFGNAKLKTSLAAQGSFKVKLIDNIKFPAN